MDEKKKNYDRHFDPKQSEILDEAIRDYENRDYQGCSCHINPPCSYCTRENEE